MQRQQQHAPGAAAAPRGLGTDFSRETFERHATLLGDSRTSHPANSVQRAMIVRQLQRDYGNRYVQRLVDYISRTNEKVQTRLTVGPAGDQYEREADQVAEQVVKRQTEEEELQKKPILQRRGGSPEEEEVAQGKLLAQRQGNPPEEEEMAQKKPLLQRQVGAEGGEAGPEVEQAIQRSRGSGKALPEGVRASMEGAFGADFSGVRVHSNAESDALNDSLSARAFTTGKDIFFRKGDYSPTSKEGQELLAHELTHVVQQNGAAIQSKKDD
jgi:hypothetical protein